jgi:hypothetical protein
MLVAAALRRENFPEKIQNRSLKVEREFAWLRRLFTPRTVFMHLGAAECSLALHAASYVERVYAIDPLQTVALGRRLPSNLRLGFSRDIRVTVAKSSVDVAFSERFAGERLHDIRASLAPGGVYVSRVTRECGARDARKLLLEAGFSAVRPGFLASVFRSPKFIKAIR